MKVKSPEGNISTVAFIDVNVVPMDEERILTHQTVLVENDRIIKVAPTEEVTLPKGFVKIDGTNKYLMPGLADMHVHLNVEEVLLLFIAFGVTTIRIMWGSETTLKWREKVNQNELLGPTIYTTGPIIDGSPSIWDGSAIVDNTEEAERVVSEHYQAGYDFIKVYNNLSVEAYQGIVAAAKKRNLSVVGHVPHAVTLEGAIKAGQKSVEHLGGYIGMLQSDTSPLDLTSFKDCAEASKAIIEAIKYVDLSKIPEAVDKTVEAGLWNCVTLAVYEKFLPYEESRELLNRPEMKYVPPRYLAS